jgi:hypothetical protein
MTDFRAVGTIMGPAGLTAVFGMGTGVTPPVSSPEMSPPRRSGRGGGGQFGGSHAGESTARSWSVALAFPLQRALTAAGSSSRGVRSDFNPGGIHTAIRSPPAWVWGGRIGVVKRSAVGTGPLRRSPALHSQPIDLVVFQEPSHCSCWKPRLGGGFALRCLQRLSGPDLATRRCPERDSRYTRGRSSPILSY